ncbi:tetratricopeptide repeat protein [Bacillus sp. SM2101]|uniref:tetratricopeptide repeat protein n=1 Tax=Bacillus sp. SM2101 TaxID=2805366 RepID=UPI001BDDD0BE|nr:tetratricopeptide repeat protein [Bacillus sp. SM2101]
MKRQCNFKWHGYVHEVIEVSGKVLKTDIAIKHKSKRRKSDRNIRIYEKAIAKGATFSPRDILHYANECLDHKYYEQAIHLYETILAITNQDKEFKCYAIWKIADTYINLKNYDKAIEYCLGSFKVDSPKAEICCRLATCFQLKNDIHQAISWYKIATTIEIPQLEDCGFPIFQESCYTWIPHLKLCACYIYLEDYSKAKVHNELAEKYIPNSFAVKEYNRFLHEKHLES